MSLIVRFLHGAEYPGCEDSAPCSIYSDVTSIHFSEDDRSMALMYVREPVKTALVPGFCENEKRVLIGGSVFVMNEHGKTIAVHRRPPAAPEETIEYQTYQGYEPLNIRD